MREQRQFKLREVGPILTGRTPPTNRPEFLGQGVAFVTPTDISDGSIYPSPKRRLSALGEAEFARVILPVGSICYTCIASIGKICLTNEPSLTNQQINSIIVDEDNYCSRWLFYALRNGRVSIAMTASGSATPIINKSAFGELTLTAPPLDEQGRIAAILGAYDDLIEVNRRRIAVLEAMARGLFEEWFIRFRFPGHETHKIIDTPDGPLPEGWCLSEFNTLADIQWGDTSTTKHSYSSKGYTAYSAAGPDGLLPYFDYDRIGVVLSAIGTCGRTYLARGKWSCIKNTMRFWSISNAVST